MVTESLFNFTAFFTGLLKFNYFYVNPERDINNKT